ncbi:MAG: leucyl aminopeptidase, partial [Alphaproteobacteria bacterium]|nr:leucyl aminopeptidase [Alphaproteobacteria bacterium]
SGRSGTSLSVVGPANIGTKRLLVLGMGKLDEKSAGDGFAKLGAGLVARLKSLRVAKAVVVLDGPEFNPEAIAGLVAGMRLRHYEFDKYKSKKPDDDTPQPPDKLGVTLVVGEKRATDKAIANRDAVTEGTLLARTLSNEPANVLGPAEFATIANRLADHGLEVEVFDDDRLAELGMGALLSVAQGSARPARLVVLEWRGAKKSSAPVAFIGKGVCFDSGGISIKPAGGMGEMKGDMGGAAAVVGLMKSFALRKAKLNAVGVIGLVENMPDGKATRPGDIVTSMSGQTIEVDNTDAEGRLVLADALWYTEDRFKPRFMIDLATLTGAVMVALSHVHAGLFTPDDGLADQIEKAGIASGETVWRLPLNPAYDKMINSRFADMKNSGGRWGGASTAAQFLKRFVRDVAWAHIDVAGTAFGAPSTDINRSWGSGYGVALLDRLARDNFEGK